MSPGVIPILKQNKSRGERARKSWDETEMGSKHKHGINIGQFIQFYDTYIYENDLKTLENHKEIITQAIFENIETVMKTFENKDLDTLCGEQQLNLSFTTKVKFKTAIKQIQSKYKPQKNTPTHIIAITMKEQKYLNKIKNRLKNTENIQFLFTKYFNEIDKELLYKQIEECKLKQLKNNDLNTSYYMSISIALLTCAFIALTCIDIMEQWQHDFANILFIFCDCIIRIMPIILILQCKDTISWYYIVFGAQFMLYLEIFIWYEIYQYYPDFPIRKIYPFTYNALYNKCNHIPIISTPIPISHIAMQSQPNKKGHLSIERFDHSSYENPRYIENSSNGLNNDTSTVIILSPVSVSSDEISQTYMAGMSEEIETKYDH